VYEMDNELAQFGLVGERLGFANVVDTVAVVVIGIFTSLFFSRLDESVSQQRLQQLTLIALAVTLFVFSTIRICVDSRVSRELRQYSRDYWRLMMQVVQFLRHASLFLLTHFLSSAFIKVWSDLQLSAAESFDVMWRTFVMIYFLVQLMKKVAP